MNTQSKLAPPPPLPSVVPHYWMGPLPVRATPGLPYTVIICDASTADTCHRWFRSKADRKEYLRLHALSSKGNSPTLFVITPVEAEVLDWFKENCGRHPGTRKWAAGSRGKGITKQYKNMRTWSYLDQHFITPLADLRGRHVGAHKADLPKEALLSPRACPAADTARNDIRLGSMYASAFAIKQQEPNAVIYFYLRGDRIASRFEDLRNVTGSLAQMMLSQGTVLTGKAADHLKRDLDGYLNVAGTTRGTMPVPHPNTPAPALFEFSDIVSPDSVKWEIEPESLPLLRVPQTIRPAPDVTARVIADTNANSHLYAELQALVSSFAGDIKMIALPEMWREGRAGKDQVAAGKREATMVTTMSAAPSTWYGVMDTVMQPPDTWFYGADQSPSYGPLPTGDIRIRSEIATVIQELERNFVGRRLVVLYITIDYNCELLVRAIPTTYAIFLVLRLDGTETSTKAKEIVCNVLKPFCI